MSGYEILSADVIKDRDHVISLLNRNLNYSNDSYDWKYLNSPAGQAECRMAREEKNGRYVGSAAIFKRTLYIDGKKIGAGIAGDFSVDMEHRVIGPALNLQRKLLSEVFEGGNIQFVYAIPNDKAKALFNKIGYQKIGELRRYVKILKNEYREDEKITDIGIFSKFIDFGLKFYPVELWYGKTHGVQIEIPNIIDNRFGLKNMWLEGRCLVRGERSPAFLDWRYIQSPLRRHNLFCISRDDGKNILGYIVFYNVKNMCSVVDLQWAGEISNLDMLMSGFIRTMRDAGIGSIDIRYCGCASFRKRIQKFGFFHHAEASVDVVIYRKENSDGEKILFNEDNWHLFDGDFD